MPTIPNSNTPRLEGQFGRPALYTGPAPEPLRPAGGYEQPPDPIYDDEPVEGSVDLREYLEIIARRKWLVLGTIIACVAFAAVKSILQTPLYSTTLRLQVDHNLNSAVESGRVVPVEMSANQEFLRTQYILMESRSLAERVATQLKLVDDKTFAPEGFSLANLFVRPPPTDTNVRSPREAHVIKTLMSNRSVQPVPGTRLISLTYSDPSPQHAQRITTAFGQAFIAFTSDKRTEAGANAKSFLDDQTQQLRLRLQESERALADFAKRENVENLYAVASNAENNLAAANAALNKIIAERIKNAKNWDQLKGAKQSELPLYLSNSAIDGLRAQRKELTLDYQEKLETFKPDFPAMIQMDAQIKEIDRQLAAEIKSAVASLKGKYEGSLSEEASTRTQIEQLRLEALDLQRRRIKYDSFAREIEANREIYNSVMQRAKEVDIAAGAVAKSVTIVDSAELPLSPTSPRLIPALMLGGVLGTIIALTAAFVAEWRDDKIRTSDDIQRIFGLSILGIIPLPILGRTLEAELANPNSAPSEAYRSLCTALQFSTHEGLPKSLVVTSAGPSEGKSSTALAIARHFANLGLKVLLVDADLRNPSLHRKTGAANEVGLSTYLTGACAPPAAIQTSDLANLALMTSGPLPANAADLLSSTRLPSLLSQGQEIFDLIILDAPPVLGLADVALLSSVASGTLFVVASAQSRKRMVRDSLTRLGQCRATVIGSVLTRFDTQTIGYGAANPYVYGTTPAASKI
jgi:capsular exopolysaccharide synthesis family protein